MVLRLRSFEREPFWVLGEFLSRSSLRIGARQFEILRMAGTTPGIGGAERFNKASGPESLQLLKASLGRSRGIVSRREERPDLGSDPFEIFGLVFSLRFVLYLHQTTV